MSEDVTGLVATIGGLLIILIPVAGLTARFALKPVVEAIFKARHSPRETAILEKRVALLEQQLRSLEGSMERLAEDSEFRRQLETPRG